jgi:hypothetical protein
LEVWKMNPDELVVQKFLTCKKIRIRPDPVPNRENLNK